MAAAACKATAAIHLWPQGVASRRVKAAINAAITHQRHRSVLGANSPRGPARAACNRSTLGRQRIVSQVFSTLFSPSPAPKHSSTTSPQSSTWVETIVFCLQNYFEGRPPPIQFWLGRKGIRKMDSSQPQICPRGTTRQRKELCFVIPSIKIKAKQIYVKGSSRVGTREEVFLLVEAS